MTPEDKALELVLAVQEALATPGANAVAIARKFLDARAAQERERCAQVAETTTRRMPPNMAERLAVGRAAAAIRALPPAQHNS